jgi:adenine/guanine/hypoxanthine permease
MAGTKAGDYGGNTGVVTRSVEPGAPAGRGRLDRYFEITKRGSTARREVVAGVVTFLTMSYILFVNSAILGGVADRSGATLAFDQVLTVTALAAGVFSIAMGVIGRHPFAIAAGLGLNAFVAFSLVGANGLSWPEAMGVIVLQGLIISVLVLTGFREAVMNALPKDLKVAIGIGIGLFIMFIGLLNAGVVVRGPDGGPPVGINRDMQHWPFLVFAFGLVLTAALTIRRVKGALLLGVLGSTVLAVVINELRNGEVWANNVARVPDDVVAMPDFNLVGNFSFDFISVLGAWTAVAVVLSVLLSDFFDTMGSVTALGSEAGLLDDQGRLPNSKSVLLVDSLAAAGGGAASASSNTTYIESASGIAEGGRTGLTAVVVGLLFLACLFISPLAGVIPPEATAAVLVIVGYFLITQVVDIRWKEPRIGLSALLTVGVMPFTFSITNGVGAGIVLYVVLSLLTGRARTVHPLLYLVAGVFTWYFVHGAI